MNQAFTDVKGILRGCQLFDGIDEADIDAILHCLQASRRTYRKGEVIFSQGCRIRQVGVVLSGSVHVIKEDYWGKRVIFARVGPGEMFAEGFCLAGVNDLPVSVMASSDSEVLFADYRKIIASCSSACVYHIVMIGNMLQILATKNLSLTEKIQHITQRSTRDKLLSYLSEQARQASSRRFDIPLNRQELADYLSVERSAMSAELSKMQRDGLVKYNKNHFEIPSRSLYGTD